MPNNSRSSSVTDRSAVPKYSCHKITSLVDLSDLSAHCGQRNIAVVPGPERRHDCLESFAGAAFVDFSAMKSVLEHSREDQVIKVQTGMLVSELNSFLSKHRQWLPVNCSPDSTILDLILRGQGGAPEHHFGGPRNLVIGGTAVVGHGRVIKYGGRVVKNVTGYDLGKLFVGSHGWLGLPESCFLRLYALPEVRRTLVFELDSQDAFKSATKLMRSGLPITSLDLLSAPVAARILSQQLPPSKLCLVAQVCGGRAVVESISTTAVGEVGAASLILEGADDAKFWHAESCFEADATAHECSTMLINIPATLMSTLIRRCPYISDWIARPGVGKIFFSCPEQRIEDVLATLATIATESGEKLYAGFGDSVFEHRAVVLPAADENLEQLKRRVKSAMDPDGIMNPLVEL